jgi:hypothetical protein
VADEPLADLASDPVGYVRKLVAVEARAEAMRKSLAKHVDTIKQDIQADDVWFGRNKPKSDKKSPACLYKVKGDGDGDNTAGT